MSARSNKIGRYKGHWLGLCLLLCVCAPSKAANLQLRNATIEGGGRVKVEVAWEHYWGVDSEPPFNHDAVWLFVYARKKDQSGSAFMPIEIAPTGGVANVSWGSSVVMAASDNRGVFVRRTGHEAPIPIEIQLLSSMVAGNTDAWEFRIFGIEMVWVPDGPFALGDGKSLNTLGAAPDGKPYQVSSEQQIKIGQSAGQLLDSGKYAPAGDLPDAYPKGYRGFYCMKYEVTQQQYVDFLNCLTYEHQRLRTVTSPSSPSGTAAMFSSLANRSTVVVWKPGKESAVPAVYACNGNMNSPINSHDDGKARAMNFLTFFDLACYLDWAGLRLMTELEFEKAARGAEPAIAKQMAWGTDKVTDANLVTNDGTLAEAAKPIGGLQAGFGVASHGYDGPPGPLRSGFSASAQSGRLEAGGSYYGIFELSGNVWETVIGVTGNGPNYRADMSICEIKETRFDLHPLFEPVTVGTTVPGSGVRGGAWNSGVLGPYRDLAISDRYYGSFPSTERRGTIGGRGVRYR